MENYIYNRLSRLRKSLRARGLDAVLIFGPENRFYFSGFWAEDLGCLESSGALLITNDENFLLTDGRYKEQAQKEAKGFEIKIYKSGLPIFLKSLFKELSIKSCGYEPNYLPVARFNLIKKELSKVEWKEFKGFSERLRAEKDPFEIKIIKEAQGLAEEVFEDVLRELKPGLSEKELFFKILKGLYYKADGPSFPPIVASGPNSSLPHAVPTNRTIGEKEPIIIDMGARFKGYCSDMTRTVFLKEPSEEFKVIYRIVKEAQKAAQDFIKAGISGKDADEVARKIISQKGYGDYFCHSLGHGVGIAIHEPPVLSFRNRKRLRKGNVITIEPGIYIPDKGGVRLENMAIVAENGIEVLTSQKWYYDF